MYNRYEPPPIHEVELRVEGGIVNHRCADVFLSQIREYSNGVSITGRCQC